jgi:hypothetical protein
MLGKKAPSLKSMRPSGGRVGSGFVFGLVAFCCAGFAAPAIFASRGYTVAGDKPKESTRDTLSISANEVQRHGGQKKSQ